MPAMTIIVEYETLDGQEDALTALMRDHAAKTLEEEHGCLRFEVVKPIERDGTPIRNRLMISELYADEAAFSAHANNPRIPGLGAAIKPLLVSRRLIMASAIDGGAEVDALRPAELNASNDG